MKKKTIAIVSIALVLSLLAVAVIATFPTYLFEDKPTVNTGSEIQSGNITENNGGVQGEDEGILGGKDGVQAVLPEPDNDKPANDKTDNDKPDNDKSGLSDTPNTELSNLAEAKGAKILAQSGAYDDGTEMKLKKLGILNKAYYRARHYLRGIAEDFVAYDFSATIDGKEATPDAIVRIVFDIPENFDKSNVAIYYLFSNYVEELNGTVSEDGKTMWVTISQSGVYILAEKTADAPSDDEPADDTSSKDENNSSNASSNASSDSSDVSSDNSSNEDTSSDADNDNSSDSSSDNNSSEDENVDTMEGWTPWY